MTAKTKLVLSTKDFSSPETKAVDRLDAIYQLADYCIDLLQQNEEHHGEVSACALHVEYLQYCHVFLDIQNLACYLCNSSLMAGYNGK